MYIRYKCGCCFFFRYIRSELGDLVGLFRECEYVYLSGRENRSLLEGGRGFVSFCIFRGERDDRIVGG